MIYNCCGTNNKRFGIPYSSKWYLRYLIWHEFGHSFVNPVTANHSDRVASQNKLIEPVKENMKSMGYGDWETCVNEHVVRAVHNRLVELHLGSLRSKFWLKLDKGKGFIYIEPLIEKLKEFEIQRDKNNISFSEFYPELLDVLDSLQP